MLGNPLYVKLFSLTYKTFYFLIYCWYFKEKRDYKLCCFDVKIQTPIEVWGRGKTVILVTFNIIWR